MNTQSRVKYDTLLHQLMAAWQEQRGTVEIAAAFDRLSQEYLLCLTDDELCNLVCGYLPWSTAHETTKATQSQAETPAAFERALRAYSAKEGDSGMVIKPSERH